MPDRDDPPAASARGEQIMPPSTRDTAGSHGTDNVVTLASAQAPDIDIQTLRALEAHLFLAGTPLREAELARAVGLPTASPANDGRARPGPSPVVALLRELQRAYANRGVHLVRRGDRWGFISAPDLAGLLSPHRTVARRLSRAALETLAIIAYHQPVTRAEIEDIRGVATSKGTLDQLMEIGWIGFKARRRAPGRPMTYGVTNDFLQHFGLESLAELPGMADLKSSGLLSAAVPAGFQPELELGLAGLSDAALDADLPEDDEDAPADGLLGIEEPLEDDDDVAVGDAASAKPGAPD